MEEQLLFPLLVRGEGEGEVMEPHDASADFKAQMPLTGVAE
jgi:hypothetical protein